MRKRRRRRRRQDEDGEEEEEARRRGGGGGGGETTIRRRRQRVEEEEEHLTMTTPTEGLETARRAEPSQPVLLISSLSFVNALYYTYIGINPRKASPSWAKYIYFTGRCFEVLSKIR